MGKAKAPKYPVEKRGPSYQKYLSKLRRRSRWGRRVKRKKRAAPKPAGPVLIVKGRKRVIVVKKTAPQYTADETWDAYTGRSTIIPKTSAITPKILSRRLGISEKKVKKIIGPQKKKYRKMTEAQKRLLKLI